jgi:hypothetical protein
MLQFKSANGSRASRRWAKSGKAEHISKEMSSLKVYRASRWSAIGLIGDPRPKTVLDDGRLSHGSVYLGHWACGRFKAANVLLGSPVRRRFKIRWIGPHSSIRSNLSYQREP